ncbi:hypothetical protein Bca52824_046823 [Brassica carinata]|uniref:Uncharacterized protein n=1 Tax=Brassica carinata TaxID=52824 RepID=A0A8X7UQK9_BRACI|nr:hypothetical protein Bca52824_046823 [Brassica carinata]
MAQKIVFQALREATVTETDVRHFRTLAKLRKSTQADCPAAFFEEFLELHRQVLEKGMKKCKGTGDADVNKNPQSLIFQVVNWVEAEQSADSTR